MTTKRIKRRRAKIVRNIIFVIALAVFLVSAYQLLMIYMEYKRGSDEYKNLAGEAEEIFSVLELEEVPKEVSDPKEDSQIVPETMSEEEYNQMVRDFHEKMLAQNADYVGWILIPGTKINYPIVQCADNDYYLNHTWEHEKNAAGTLFVDCNIADGMEARNVIVYGHNMKNGSMFAGLKNYRDDKFYEEHKTFHVFTETGFHKYEVFSVFVTSPVSEAYAIGFADDAMFMSYVEKMQSWSLQNTGVTVNADDQILTLSTCVNNNVDRLVVQARRMKE